MPGRAAELIEIPDSLWQRADALDALRQRDIGRLFQLLRQYAGASQTRLAIACDMTQPKISGIMRGTARVETLEVFERIADGLNMPGHARIALGLAPGPAAAKLARAGYPAAEYPHGLACCHGFRSAQRRCSRQRGGRAFGATANLCRPDRRVAVRRDPGRYRPC